MKSLRELELEVTNRVEELLDRPENWEVIEVGDPWIFSSAYSHLTYPEITFTNGNIYYDGKFVTQVAKDVHECFIANMQHFLEHENNKLTKEQFLRYTE